MDKTKSKVQSFNAILERGDRSLGWTVVRVPFEPSKIWPEMVRLRIRGTIEGPAGRVEFRSSLFPRASGEGYQVLVSRAMQQGTGLAFGAEANFELRPDTEPRPAELPGCLDTLLDDAEGLRAWYEALSEYTRREIGKWIEGVKSEGARRHRADQVAERMLATMEAEIELPPVIERAFRARPKARSGWAKMTEAQRRSELMAVFYYQTSEARGKRVAKLCDLAEKGSVMAKP